MERCLHHLRANVCITRPTGSPALETCGMMEGVNRLGASTSPYLLQHADNPVHWWEWEPAAFEEARRRDVPVLLQRRVRRLPLVPRDGARVVRGRRHRGVPQRALREHQGRPRGAARRGRGLHAGHHGDDRARRLADDRRARPRRQPVLRRHLLSRPAAARSAVVPAGAGGAGRRLEHQGRRCAPGGREAARAPDSPADQRGRRVGCGPVDRRAARAGGGDAGG